MQFALPQGTDLEFVFAKKVIRLSLFFTVLLLAAYLRITGLSWGLTSGYGHYRNFHPDEFISLRGVLQIDLLKGHVRAPSAYVEGTFNYYLWALPQAALNLFGKTGLAPTASEKIETEDHANLLYICRWMSVLFDLCTIIIVFLAIREVTQNFYPSLLGAFVYAVLPMQVIYAHFMRTHLLSNLLCSLVIWLSLKFGERPKSPLLLTVGLISGLAGATRFPNAIIAVIPCLYFLLRPCDHLPGGHSRFRERAKHFVTGSIWLIGLGFALGLFLGHPMLFLDLPSVINDMKGSVFPHVTLWEFKLSNLLNFSVIWRYAFFLIPCATYPFLWLLPYCAILYLCCRRSLYGQSFPILIFSGLYLYIMAKGYEGGIFARATMLLFPGFCILVGVAFGDLWLLLRKHRVAVIFLITAPLLVALPSIAFDAAYVQAMQQKDARLALREDLQKLIGGTPTTIGVLRFAGYFYTVMPAIEPLKSKELVVRVQDSDEKADFFLVGIPVPIDSGLLNLAIKKGEANGRFRYEKSYRVCPKIFGQELQLGRFPTDMTYPFPTILLFRAKT
jgi:hypothetical protein